MNINPLPLRLNIMVNQWFGRQIYTYLKPICLFTTLDYLNYLGMMSWGSAKTIIEATDDSS